MCDNISQTENLDGKIKTSPNFIDIYFYANVYYPFSTRIFITFANPADIPYHFDDLLCVSLRIAGLASRQKSPFTFETNRQTAPKTLQPNSNALINFWQRRTFLRPPNFLWRPAIINSERFHKRARYIISTRRANRMKHSCD